MVSSFPKSLDVLFGAMTLIAKRVAALTDGKFQIHPFGAGEIVPGLKVLDGRLVSQRDQEPRRSQRLEIPHSGTGGPDPGHHRGRAAADRAGSWLRIAENSYDAYVYQRSRN
jgi:hypothetical protein